MKLTRLLLFLLLTGCATMNVPTPEQEASADYGSFPGNYKEVIQEHMQRALKDPDSTIYSYWRGPSKGYVADNIRAHYGYKVCAEINSKNSYGGYTGSQPYYFVIYNYRVIKADGGHQPGSLGEERVLKVCNSIKLSQLP